MTLELVGVSKVVGRDTHIDDVSLTLPRGSLNVLLGPTLAGKTTLMRLMAGLDQPTSGRVRFDRTDVTGVPVQKRSVAMVYQQFINYPNLSVYENIASPMRIKGLSTAEIDRAVRDAAALMKLSPYLDRKPLELSGGQQQRTALARAVVKRADLVLLDEPLANLDYKLREELREELPRLFAETGAIFVYATTEPTEALLLGGNTATLSQGRVTQFGPTVEVYRRPRDLLTAQTFSDPPLNVWPVEVRGGRLLSDGRDVAPASGALARLGEGATWLAFRPNHLRLGPGGPSDLALPARVIVTEITGSESFIHVVPVGQADGGVRWIALAHGVHDLPPGTDVIVHVAPERVLAFPPTVPARAA